MHESIDPYGYPYTTGNPKEHRAHPPSLRTTPPPHIQGGGATSKYPRRSTQISNRMFRYGTIRRKHEKQGRFDGNPLPVEVAYWDYPVMFLLDSSLAERSVVSHMSFAVGICTLFFHVGSAGGLVSVRRAGGGYREKSEHGVPSECQWCRGSCRDSDYTRLNWIPC